MIPERQGSEVKRAEPDSEPSSSPVLRSNLRGGGQRRACLTDDERIFPPTFHATAGGNKRGARKHPAGSVRANISQQKTKENYDSENVGNE